MPKKKYDLPRGLQNKPVGSENWYQVFYRKDRQPTIKWVRLDAHDLSGAKIERERLLRLFELGLFDPWEPKAELVPRKDPTLADAVTAYLETQKGLAANTYKGKRSCLTTFKERSGRSRRRIREITDDDIERFIERPGITEATRHKRLVQLVGFFDFCVSEAFRDDNPALEYKKKRNKGLSNYARRKRGGEAREALMPNDIRTLLSKIQEKGQHPFLVDVVLFALATGLRRNEITHLNHRDVYLDAPPPGRMYPVTGWVRVRCWQHPVTGKRFITKNGKDRSVPLCPLAARIVHRNMNASRADDPWAPVFLAPQGGRIEGKRLSVWFYNYREEVGFTDRVTFHSLRHSFASWLMMLGVNLFSIKRLLGHSSLDQLDTYAELCEEFFLGSVRSLQSELLLTFCPDLPDAIVDRVLPRRRSLLAALSDEKFGHVQTLHSAIPMEDVLFSGFAYEGEQKDVADVPEPRPRSEDKWVLSF